MQENYKQCSVEEWASTFVTMVGPQQLKFFKEAGLACEYTYSNVLAIPLGLGRG